MLNSNELKFFLLKNIKMPTIVNINIYEQDKYKLWEF